MRPQLLVQAALLAVALTVYGLVLVQAAGRHQDFDAYLAAARDLWHGHSLYASFLHHPFPDATLRPAYIYPPAFALLLAPIAIVPSSVSPVLWLLFCQAALLASLLLMLRAERPSAWAATAVLCLTFSFYPLWVDAIQGQANLPVLLLVLAGVVGIARGRPAWAAALGAAAALKLTPFLLLAWLLLERRFREAAWMTGGFALLTAAGALVRFDDTVVFFTRVLPALAGGTAFYANHSLSGVLARIFVPNPYTDIWFALPYEVALTALLAVLLGGFWVWQRHRGAPLHRALAFLPLLPLLSAVTWPHHLVILLPVMWGAVFAVARRGWPLAPTLAIVLIAFALSLLARWQVGPGFGEAGFRSAQTMDPLVFLVANSLFVGTLLLFLTAPWLLRSR